MIDPEVLGNNPNDIPFEQQSAESVLAQLRSYYDLVESGESAELLAVCRDLGTVTLHPTTRVVDSALDFMECVAAESLEPDMKQAVYTTAKFTTLRPDRHGGERLNPIVNSLIFSSTGKRRARENKAFTTLRELGDRFEQKYGKEYGLDFVKAFLNGTLTPKRLETSSSVFVKEMTGQQRLARFVHVLLHGDERITSPDHFFVAALDIASSASERRNILTAMILFSGREGGWQDQIDVIRRRLALHHVYHPTDLPGGLPKFKQLLKAQDSRFATMQYLAGVDPSTTETVNAVEAYKAKISQAKLAAEQAISRAFEELQQ